jgi:hypothetical protein
VPQEEALYEHDLISAENFKNYKGKVTFNER